MSSSSLALAALSALFQTPTPVVDIDTLELPTNLDEFIQVDAACGSEILGYRWYRGKDQAGVQRIFRFPRAGSLQQWHETLQAQRLRCVSGPFRTLTHAQSQGPSNG